MRYVTDVYGNNPLTYALKRKNYETHKEAIAKQHQEYRERNKEAISQRTKNTNNKTRNR